MAGAAIPAVCAILVFSAKPIARLGVLYGAAAAYNAARRGRGPLALKSIWRDFPHPVRSSPW